MQDLYPKHESAKARLVQTIVLIIFGMFASACPPDTGGTFTKNDAGGGIVPDGITAADIGTICTYDPTRPSVNPTNTCAKPGLTCLIDTSDGAYSQYGNFVYEAIPLFARPMPDGHDEGICTLVAQAGQILACPAGTAAVTLSTGQSFCLRACSSSSECNREGYVCDAPFMNGASFDPQTGAVSPLAQKFCVPACATDLPYCTRSFLRPDGQGGNLLDIRDLNGDRQCEPTTGLCQDVTSRGGKFVGDLCTHSDECGENLICIGGMLFGAPDEYGFCAQQCNPFGTTSEQTGCAPGLSCEFFLDVGYCFPDCNNNVCGGENQVCQVADANTAGLREGQDWRAPHCIPCEMSSLPCASHSNDAGIGDDSGLEGDASADGDAGTNEDAN